MNELVGKYLNGYKIVKVENDPFIKGQVNLWTNETRRECFGDRSVIKFFVRDEGNTAKIYQELIDRENYELKQRINKAIEYIEEYHYLIVDYDSKEELLKILRGEENE